MATLDGLTDLLVADESINNSARSLSYISSVIIIVTANFNELSTGITALTTNVNDFSTDIIDLSADITDLSTDIIDVFDNVNDFGSNITDLSADIIDVSSNVDDFGSDMAGLSKKSTSINEIGSSLDQMNNKLEKADTNSKKVGESLLKFAKKAFSLDNIKKGIKAVDQYITAYNKLADINDNSQSQMELQDKINVAATRSSLSYTDMANAVSGIGNLDTFKQDNDSAIGFTELLQKSLKNDESSTKLSDVTGTMSDNVISGDELKTLGGSDSTIVKALSSYTGKSGDQLKALANQGQITANLLKNAMFAASNDINSEFENQPKTFADAWTRITNSAMNALNSPGIQASLSTVINVLGFVSQVISKIAGAISDSWPLISSILIAVGLYLAFIGATALPGLIASFWSFVFVENAALLPALAFIGVVAAIIFSLQLLGVSFEDIFSFIGGVVGGAVALIYNLLLGVFDLILGILNFLVNPFIDFANFFGNLFTNPISSIIYLFQGMADGILGIIETVASALDKVFGTKLAETVSGWRSGIKDMADAAVEKYAPDENYQKLIENQNLSSEDFGLSRMDYGEAANIGGDIGKNIYGKMDKALSSLSSSDGGYDFSQFATTEDTLGTTSDPVSVEGTGSNGTVGVDMEEEDLGYLRDMAERDYIANVATNTLAPNIAVSFGDVHETADVNQLYGRIQTILKEQIAIAPEGVY